MKFLLCISLIFLSYQTIASSNTNINITDRCSGKKSNLLTSNGLNINLNITEFSHKHAMTIKVDFYPSTWVGNYIEKGPIAITYNYNKANSYRGVFGRRLTLPKKNLSARLIFPKYKSLIAGEKKYKSSNLWNIRIQWFQQGTSFGGIAQQSFIRLKNSTEDIFKLKSSAICHWESYAAVSSKLYTNDHASFKSISKNYSDNFEFGPNKGINAGPSNIGGGSPLGQSDNWGWIFKNWETNYSNRTIEKFHRRWTLSRHESGVFATRHSFSRQRAIRLTWQHTRQKNGKFCKEYREVSEGFIDIGRQTEDFYVLPQELYGTDEMNEFIERYRPSLNSCTHNITNGEYGADDVIFNKNNTIIYYYKERVL